MYLALSDGMLLAMNHKTSTSKQVCASRLGLRVNSIEKNRKL